MFFYEFVAVCIGMLIVCICGYYWPLRRGQRFIRRYLTSDIILTILREVNFLGVLTLFILFLEWFIPFFIPLHVIESSTFMTWFNSSHILIKLLILTVIQEFFTYWSHRFMHSFDFFWDCHKFHHAPQEMGSLSAYRSHFFFSFVYEVFHFLPFAIFVVGGSDLWLFYALERMLGFLMHANVDFRWPSFLKYIFVSPVAHAHHHTREGCDKNYGGVLMIWDVVFGTYEHPLESPRKIGFDENVKYPKGFFAQQFYPVTKRLAKSKGDVKEKTV